MKKAVATLFLLIASLLPIGFAEWYVGAELGGLLSTNTADLSSRDLGAQLGVTFSGLGLRAAVEGNLAERSLTSGSLDALLNLSLLGQNLYFGAGADVFDLGQLSTIGTAQAGFGTALGAGAFGAHAVLGAEVRLSLLGVFGEIQPVYRLGLNGLEESSGFFRTRAGVNIHF